MTASVVTPYAQQENHETGRQMGRNDRVWGIYDPPRTGDAAELAGYETGWSLQDVIETERHAASDHEARWELALEYAEMTGG